MKIRFHPLAEKEFGEAILWYSTKIKGLDQEYIFSIDEAIHKIEKNPDLYPFIYKSFQRIIVRRFPYSLFYKKEKNEIRVIAVMHMKRNPSLLQHRF